MTTDPDEGERQTEAAIPKLKIGDVVRLSAGGTQRSGNYMKIVGFEDYGNAALCEWTTRDQFPVRDLTRVEKAE